jgi:hypothetical protein
MPTIPVHLHRIRVGLHQGDCRGFRVQTRLIGALKDPRADLPGLVIFHLEADTGRWYIICVHGGEDDLRPMASFMPPVNVERGACTT